MKEEKHVKEKIKKFKLFPGPYDRDTTLKGLDEYIERLCGKVWEDPEVDEITITGGVEDCAEKKDLE